MNPRATPRPAYRYLEPPPAPTYGRLQRRARWVLMVGALAWVLILLAGFLLASTGSP